MSDDIRSLIRAAQEAEGRREPLEAASHLQRAAERLERSGRPARAVQLLRHAVRLSGDPGMKQHLEALERELAAQEPPTSQAGGQVFELDADDVDGALPFSPPPGTPGALNPRPSLSVVGSPDAGPPVDAPLRLQTRALSAAEGSRTPARSDGAAFSGAAPEGDGAEPPSRTYRSDAGVGGLLLAHHVPVLGQVEVALSEGMRVVLLLGPQGSGRSTCLSALAARLGGVIVGAPFTAGFPPAELLLIDDAHRLEASAWAELERGLRSRPKMRLVLAAPRTPDVGEGPGLVATTPAGQVPLWTTAEILAVSPGLPPALAGRVEQVVEVALPLPSQLERLARELLTTHRPRLRNPGPVAEVLVAHTLRSPRGLHELIALVHRLPMDVQTVRRRSPPSGSGTPRRASKKASTGTAPSKSAQRASDGSTAGVKRASKAKASKAGTSPAAGSGTSRKAGAAAKGGATKRPAGTTKGGKAKAPTSKTSKAKATAQPSRAATAAGPESRGRARNTIGAAAVGTSKRGPGKAGSSPVRETPPAGRGSRRGTTSR